MAGHQARAGQLLAYGSLLLIGWCLWLVVQPFLVPLGWAAILALCFWPVHQRLATRLGATTAAWLSTTLISLVLVVPATLLGIALAQQAAGAVEQVQATFAQGLPEPLTRSYAWLRDWSPAPLPPVEELGARISDLLRSAGAVIARQAGAVLGAMFVLILDLAVLVLALYFCFRDGPNLANGARRLLPFDEVASARIASHLHDLIHASVTSGVIVAAVQGLLGGIIFALLGIQGAIFWGVVMGFLSLLPLVGSWLVWLPVALWLLATDHVTKGIILIVLGAVLVGGVDNVLRPLHIGKRSSLSMLLLFIGLLGGVSAFGFIGLVLGPVVIALALAVYQAQVADEPVAAERSAVG